MQTAKEPKLIDIFDEIARGSNLDQALTLIAQKAATDLKAPACKIWVVKHGDICERCPLAEICTNRQMCLHLIAASGTNLEKEYPRIPLAILNTSLIVRGGIADFKDNSLSGDKLFGIQRDEYRSAQSSYALYPLRGISGTVGLLGVFSDTELEVESIDTLAQLSPLAVAAIRIAELQAKCESLRLQVEKEATAPSGVFEKRVQELEEANHQLKNELNKLHAEYDELNKLRSQYDDLIRQKEESENRLKQLEKDNAHLQQIVSWDAPQKSKEGQSESASSTTETANEPASENPAESANASSTESNATAENVQELETRLAALETSEQELRDRQSSLLEQLANLTGALQSAEESKSKLEQDLANASSASREEIENLRQALEQFETDKTNFFTERERLQNELAEMQLANTSLKEEISRLNEVNKTVSDNLAEVEAKLTEQSKISNEELEAKLAHTEAQLEEQTRALIEKLERAESQVSELSGKFEESAKATERIAELEQENAALKDEKSQLEDAVKTLDLIVPRLEETTTNLRNRIELNERLRTNVEHKNRDLMLENQRLKLKEQAELKMFANLSHELRTPVNSVIGFTSLILDDATTNLSEKHRHNLERVLKNSRNLADFLNNILDYSKIEAGLMDVYAESTSLKDVVERALEVAEGLREQDEVKLNAEFDEDLPAIRTDKTKLQQILLNLLSNAIKFTSQGEIKVKVMNVGDGRIRLAVSDTGIGISEAEIPRIFEEFRQLPPAQYSTKAGSGLGLAITRRLVVLLGGDIAVSSKVGEGSTFTITLPPEIESSVAPAAETEGQIVDPERTALVISQDAATLYLIRKYLSDIGYSAATTSNPVHAFELVRIAKPSLIAFDLDGFENPIASITQIAEHKDAGNLLAFSNNPEFERRSLKSGADKFVQKPLSRAALLEILEHPSAPKEDFILVVDDDPDALEITRTMLEGRGHLVKTAKDGLEAISEINRHTPAAVVLDLMMPQMDGIEVAYLLQTNPRWCEIPIVLLTARDLSNEERAALNYKSVQVIHKGAFSREELIAAMSEAVGRNHQ
ncbi:MAG: ATP-binding protein [Acidobacteriota bacterium]